MRLHCHRYHVAVRLAWPPLAASISLAALLVVACGSAPEPIAPKQEAAFEPQAPVWPRWQEAMSWPVAARAPLAHGGHGNGTYTVEVHVNSPAQAMYLNLTAQSSLPLGTVVVQVQRDRSGTASSAFAMEKNADDPAAPWIFSLLTSEGRVRQSGALPGCSRCHAEGLADSLFGPAHAP